MTICYLALGSNIEDRIGYLAFAVSQLRQIPGLQLKAVSPVYETAPIGGPVQDAYLNAVVKIQTGMPALKILEHCQRIEAMANRTRDERWGPRTLDIDVIMVGNQVAEDTTLNLPHPRAHERACRACQTISRCAQSRSPGPLRCDQWQMCPRDESSRNYGPDS